MCGCGCVVDLTCSHVPPRFPSDVWEGEEEGGTASVLSGEGVTERAQGQGHWRIFGSIKNFITRSDQ